MSVMTSNVWSSSQIEFRVDTLDGDARWQMNPEEQTWIFHLGGRLQQVRTETKSGLISEQLPLPGEMWKIGAGDVYEGTARGESMAYLLLRLSPRDFKALSGVTASEATSPLCFYDPKLAASVLGVREQVSRDSFDKAKTRLEATLAPYLRHESRRTESPRLSKATEQALETVISQRLEERLRLEDLAEASGLSRSQLCRRFEGTFGTSPGSYILRQRVRRAAEILSLQPPTNLSSLALDLGFSSHFSHAFRVVTGRTPSDFARGPHYFVV